MSQSTLDDDELFGEAASEMRADAFDDAADLEDEIESLEGLLTDVTDAHEQVSELASTIPGLRGALEDVHEDTEGAEAEDEEAEAAEAD